MPGQVLRVPGGWGSQISRNKEHEGGKAVSPKHWLPLPPGNIPGTYLCKRPSQPQGHSVTEGLCQWKIPMTSSGIEPTTLGLVAQSLNQLRHHIGHIYIYSCHYLFLTMYICKLDVLIVYSFLLLSPWGWKCIPKTYRRVYINVGVWMKMNMSNQH